MSGGPRLPGGLQDTFPKTRRIRDQMVTITPGVRVPRETGSGVSSGGFAKGGARSARAE